MRKHAIKRVGTVSALALSIAGLGLASTASAQTGGAAAPGVAPTPAAPTSAAPTNATILPNGRAVAPAGAPTAVVNAINAGNQIRKRRYVYGGGHASFFSKGYDCSGTVSYLLHGAGLLSAPMPSGPFMRWGAPGPGAWITTYANRGHMFIVVAGLRMDTSSYGETVRLGKPGTGPRWRSTPRGGTGFVARHPLGL